MQMVKEVIGGQVPDWQIAEFMETRSGDVEAVYSSLRLTLCRFSC